MKFHHSKTGKDTKASSSTEQIVQGLAYIHRELETAFPIDSADAQIAAAELAAANEPLPDTAKFQTKMLQYIQDYRREQSAEAIIKLPTTKDLASNTKGLAIAARSKRKSVASKHLSKNRKKDATS